MFSGFELVTSAYAESGAQAAPPGGTIGAFAPIILMFVVFYFLLIRPQQKRAKAHEQMVAALKHGDEVVTQGGVHGTVVALTDAVVTLEVSEKQRIKFDRSAIARRKGDAEQKS